MELLLAALKEEVQPLKSKLALDWTVHWKPALFYRGQFLNREVSLLVSGIGEKRVQRGLEQILSLARPDGILLVGYAGGASPVAGAATLVVADKVVQAKTGEGFPTSEKFFHRACQICEEKKLSYQTGGMVTVDRVIRHPHEKADLGATHSAIALDMEAAAVGRFALAHQIPFLAAKAVLDPVEERVPPLEGCYDAMGDPQWKNLADQFLKNPKAMLRLFNLYYWASQARRTIAKFVEGWVARS